MRKFAALTLALFLCAGTVFAATNKNSGKSSSSTSSTGSFGLGYSKMTIRSDWYNQSYDFDQIAGRYWFNDTMGIDVKLGFGSGEATSRLLLGANIIGKFINVNKLNVYWLVGINFGSFTYKGTGGDLDISLFGFQGGVGAEYFVLPCLSVLTEMGIRYKSIKPDVTGAKTDTDFGIFADWLPQAGVRFYF